MDKFVEQSICLDCCNNLLKADASFTLQLLVFLGALGEVHHERQYLSDVLRRVLLAQFLLPAQVVHGISPVAVRAHGEHIGGRAHHPT